MNNIIKKFNFPDEICSRIFYFYTTSKHKKELDKCFYNRASYIFDIGSFYESMFFLNYKNDSYTKIITTKYSYTFYNMNDRISELLKEQNEKIEEEERRIQRGYEEDEKYRIQREYEEEQDRKQREYEEEIY